MNIKLLAGVLIGMAVMYALLTGIELYTDINTRLAFVEGYLRQLDAYIQSAQQSSSQFAGR